MARTGPSAALSAARLSSLSTATLSSILELVRLQQSSQTLPSSSKNGVSKNLNTLRSGIETLLDEQAKLEKVGKGGRALMSEDERKDREIITQSLKKQYARLVGLAEGLGIQANPLDQQEQQRVYSEDALIDSSSSDVPMATLAPSQPIPHIRIDMEEDDNDEEDTRSGHPYQQPYRDDPDDARMDEEEMRKANQDVMLMQRQMMDQQDDTLDQLSAAISRQRDLSLTISSELELHETLLEETDAAVDRTQSRLQRASKSLDTVARKTREHGSACMIITLIVLLGTLVIIIKL